MEDIKRILVLSRITAECNKVLRYGFAMSQKCGARLYVLHINYDPFMHGGLNLPIPNMEKEYELQRQRAKAEVDLFIKGQKEKGMEFEEIIREGKPVKEILDVVEKYEIDLLLMLGHSEGRLEHLLFGYTKDEILRRMPCSVFVIRDEPVEA